MLAESDDLRGAHKSQVQWVEKEDHLFPSVVWKLNLLEGAIYHGGAPEVWGGPPDVSISRGHDWKLRGEGWEAQRSGLADLRSQRPVFFFIVIQV